MLRWKVAKRLLHLFKVMVSKDLQSRDFPGSPVVKNLSLQGGHGLDPWSGRIPHAEGRLSRCSSATIAHASVPVLLDKRSPRNEEPTHHSQDPRPL